jgi:hypothetical protein
MRTFLAVMLALLVSCTAAIAQDGPLYCRSNAQYAAATSGNTVLVTGRAGANIFVCGFQFWGAGTANDISLVYGTGSACATGETQLTPPYTVTAQNGIADTSPVFRGLFVPPNTDLCVKRSAAQAAQVEVFYAQR